MKPWLANEKSGHNQTETLGDMEYLLLKQRWLVEELRRRWPADPENEAFGDALRRVAEQIADAMGSTK